MSLASRSFFLAFLPITFLLYWQVFRRPRQKLWFLCVISYLFYALGSWMFAPLLFGLSLLTFWLARRKRTLPGVAVNLLALFVFKYWDFGAQNINHFASVLGAAPIIPLLQLALPLGISFYIFKHVGYLLDVRQGLYPPTGDFLLFTTFSAFFAQIEAGPISSFQDTGEQLRALPSTLSREAAYQGFVHMSLGCAKKMLIADALNGILQNTLFAQGAPQIGLLSSWFLVIVYALQIYFDFSAYTDIALGVGYVFGITLPPNFNNPYFARNPSDFWQRWHISLSLWFRIYVFSPLSRSLLRRTRRSEFSQFIANMVTMLLVGLWHGSQWGFVLWGGYHGLLLNIYAGAKRRRLGLNVPLLGHLVMIIAILIGWVFFLSPSLSFATALFAGMAGLHGIGSLNDVLIAFGTYNLMISLLALLITVSGITEAANLPQIRHPAILFIFGILMGLCLLSSGTLAPFIYAQF